MCLETQFPILKTDSFTSSYPRKYAFQRPIIASMVTIHPTKFGENPSPTPPPMMSDAGDTRVQLQLHGNTHGNCLPWFTLIIISICPVLCLSSGEAMDVDEGGVINVQFNALSDKQLFFYILCLEETGTHTHNHHPTAAPLFHYLIVDRCHQFLERGRGRSPKNVPTSGSCDSVPPG